MAIFRGQSKDPKHQSSSMLKCGGEVKILPLKVDFVLPVNTTHVIIIIFFLIKSNSKSVIVHISTGHLVSV